MNKNYYGIHVHFPECEVGQHEHVFMGSIESKDPDHPALEDLRKAIIKIFPDLEERIEIIRYQDLLDKKHLFFLEGFFFNERGYPILVEKKRPAVSMSVSMAA